MRTTLSGRFGLPEVLAEELEGAKRWVRDSIVRLEAAFSGRRSASWPVQGSATDPLEAVMAPARARGPAALRIVRGHQRRDEIASYMESLVVASRGTPAHEWNVTCANELPRAAAMPESAKTRIKTYSTPADRIAADTAEFRTIQ